MNPAPNLILIGPMGAGKSCIGRRLAQRYGLRLADVDREIEQRTGASVTMIFECEGEAGFRARERAALAELLAGDGVLRSACAMQSLHECQPTVLRTCGASAPRPHWRIACR